MKNLQGKRALVTGAASGIGQAIALALARQGVSLCLLDIDAPGLKATADRAREAGVSVLVRLCDLSRSPEIRSTIDGLPDPWKQLDILVNNAGVAYYGPTHLMSESQWDRLLAVNFQAPLQLIRLLLPRLLERPEAHILNVSSIAGLVASPRLAAYHATKFALVGLSESLRAEYGPRGLGVTALCPGLVATRFLRTAMNGRPERPLPTPPGWVCTSVEVVADRAVRAIRRNRGVVLVGLMAHVLWAFKRFSPRLLESVQCWRRRRRVPQPVGQPAVVATLPESRLRKAA